MAFVTASIARLHTTRAKLAASSSHNLLVINSNERTCALVPLNKNAVNLTALSGGKSKMIFDSSACYSTERICF
jgi:hypothetical protein